MKRLQKVTKGYYWLLEVTRPLVTISNQGASATFSNRSRSELSNLNSTGSILVDLLVGTAILATGLFSVWLSLMTITDFTIRNEQLSLANTALQNQIEIIRSTEYDSLITGQTIQTVPTLPSGQLIQVISDAETELKQIELTLTWQARTGTRTTQATTRVTRGGLGRN